jgi:serine protease SohB
MITFIEHYGLFLAEVTTIVVAILILLSGMVAILGKNKFKPKEKMEIIKLNEKYDDLKNALNSETLDKTELKDLLKKEKQQEKDERKLRKEEKTSKPRIFVLEFDGDIKASESVNLREEVTAILTVATPKDEVLIKIESAGGLVHSYGLAASQLQRIRDRKIPLVAAVDKVAASGGYMMACVADRIIAAPFAILGSIGVLAQIPNFHRLLKKYDIDYEQFMSGEFKRTVTMFGENSDKAKRKFQEEIEEAHELFKKFINTYRPIVDINKMATGEHWFGTRAKELNLVDELLTSDDYLLNASKRANLYKISYVIKQSLADKIAAKTSQAVTKIINYIGYNV